MKKQALWHPVTQMKDVEEHPLLKIASGKGIYIYDDEGKSYIDGISSWWTNIFGHANPRITEALTKQASTLEHVLFAGVTHGPAEELADRLVALTPDEMTRVFFAGDGASAVEVAMKMSYGYRQNNGQPEKTKFVGLSDGYHGDTLGALSVCGHDFFSDLYRPIMPENISVQGPDCYRCPYGKTRETCEADCFKHMEKTLHERAHEITAVFVEPLGQGAAGWRFYPALYLQKLRKLTRELDIHLAFDEIAVGFGRLGSMFAMDKAEVVPDFVTMSKSITSGTLALSAVMTTDAVYDAFYGEFSDMKAFMHSHTYTGNPLACAVANTTLTMFEELNVIETNRPKYQHMRRYAAEKFGNHKHLGEIRSCGFISCLEFVENPETKAAFDWKDRIGFQIHRAALKHGAFLRNMGDVIYFLPPYIITEDEITTLIDAAYAATTEVLG